MLNRTFRPIRILFTNFALSPPPAVHEPSQFQPLRRPCWLGCAVHWNPLHFGAMADQIGNGQNQSDCLGRRGRREMDGRKRRKEGHAQSPRTLKGINSHYSMISDCGHCRTGTSSFVRNVRIRIRIRIRSCKWIDLPPTPGQPPFHERINRHWRKGRQVRMNYLLEWLYYQIPADLISLLSL